MNELNVLVAKIQIIMEKARENVSREINTTMLNTYWELGEIVEF